MKILALGSAIFLAALLAIIGFAMIPGGPEDYVGPMRMGLASLVMLPAGYWLIADKILSAKYAAMIVLAMGITIAALWIPLLRSRLMMLAHGGAMAFWTALWAIASLPFLRVVTKDLRKPRK
ncbi:hypothetical protein SAMN06297468_1708 [Altererythrobacter xiamenensis]|uniref:Uncharacterized protein n=1 Tax=Altererythrobacter xiamenensis TaxID=1316679 RepID=A0A1Y6F7I4_9SPHN|nr:hypothetical protein [Altererythrobacter xiamenensis]SMQ69521.1 hypothetical protein SAMN06297468_1708 [Altererythrobacter xiamenensis]